MDSASYPTSDKTRLLNPDEASIGDGGGVERRVEAGFAPQQTSGYPGNGYVQSAYAGNGYGQAQQPFDRPIYAVGMNNGEQQYASPYPVQIPAQHYAPQQVPQPIIYGQVWTLC
jgi:hypothetical protein